MRCAGQHLLLPRGGQAGVAQPGGATGTPASPSSSPAVSPPPPHPPALPRPTHPLATWACSKCGLRERGARRLPCGEGLASRSPGRGPQVQNKGSRAFLQRLMREPWASESPAPLYLEHVVLGSPLARLSNFAQVPLPQPGGPRAPHPTAGQSPSWVPRPVLVEGLGISPARAASLQLGLGTPGRPQALSPVL